MRGRYRPYYKERSSRSSLCCTAAFPAYSAFKQRTCLHKHENTKPEVKWKVKIEMIIISFIYNVWLSKISHIGKVHKYSHAWYSSQIKCVTINRKNNPLNMEILWKVISAIDQMVSKAKIYSEIYFFSWHYFDPRTTIQPWHQHGVYTVLIQYICTVDSQKMQFAITSGTDICPVFMEHY